MFLGLPWWLRNEKSPAVQETQEMRVQSLDGKDPLEEDMAAHSSILGRSMLWTEEPGRIQSMGLPRVGHN